jgi:hypothetical protein
MNWWTYIDRAGSISSILGGLLGVIILIRELRMASEVHVLRAEEEKWHAVGKR